MRGPFQVSAHFTNRKRRNQNLPRNSSREILKRGRKPTKPRGRTLPFPPPWRNHQKAQQRPPPSLPTIPANRRYSTSRLSPAESELKAFPSMSSSAESLCRIGKVVRFRTHSPPVSPLCLLSPPLLFSVLHPCARLLRSFSRLSEPPDISNWFSSYVYESPDSLGLPDSLGSPLLLEEDESQTQEPVDGSSTSKV